MGSSGESASPERSDASTHGRRDEEMMTAQQLNNLSSFQKIVLNFPPSWYTTTMGTGITAMMLHELPYQFKGLDIICHIIFVLNLVIFTLVTCVTVLRYVWWPKVFILMICHPVQSLFLGAIPMAISAIINYLVLVLVPHWGHGFAIFTWVLWWINILLAIVITAGLLFVQFTRHSNSLELFSALWFLPVVCMIVASSTGAIVATVLPLQHAKLTVIMSWVTFGIGFCIAVMIVTTYYIRLTLHKIPPSGSIFSAFLPLGVFSQSAFVVLKLSEVARDIYHEHGEWLTSPNVVSYEHAGLLADALYAASIPVTLMLWGFAILWLTLAVFFVVDTLFVSVIGFNIGWWGLTFPVAVFAITTGQIGTVFVLNSEPVNDDGNSSLCSTISSKDVEIGKDPVDEKADANLVTWDEHDAHENPRTWRLSYRYMMVIVVSFYSMLCPMTSSMNAPALDILMEQFGTTNAAIGNLMMSSQILAFALGPLLYAPLSERYGRKNIMQPANFVFLIFNMSCGFATTVTQMTVLRFFTGLAGAAPISMSAGVVADLFEPEDRGQAMAFYTLAPILGPCIGPLFAGWIIQGWGADKWPWIFWFSSIYGAVIALVCFILLRETYTPVLLERKVKRLQKETGNMQLHTKFAREETLLQRYAHGCARPAIFLCTQPAVLMPCLYQAIMFGCQFLLLAEFPRVFRDEYGLPPGMAALHYIPFLIGFLFSGQIGGRFVDTMYRHLKEKNGGVGKPEFKIPLLLITAFFMPAGLLVYGWSVQYHTHWIVPDIGIVLLAIGIRAAIFVCPLYLADAVPLYSASAVAAGVSLRNLFGFSFPLFSPSLYSTLGQGWGNSLLALVTFMIGVPAPILLFIYGEKLREHSSYSKRAMALMT
ncbi:hypothetical protein MCUN1_001370 [Malassezia cuniculi]|uniref:Major facilitator superfamily (MFS) profile domain-containing protein n=1 Tax=Malassezia cuniculi TaxID=948313 RepID=A0AAF0J6G5_9BASI|nr:hypothetical protein MCUN1_001370 [Malassezia cuniculi]